MTTKKETIERILKEVWELMEENIAAGQSTTGEERERYANEYEKLHEAHQALLRAKYEFK